MSDEDQWWLASSLPKEKRDRMTEAQRADRRLMFVNERIKAAEARLTDARRRRLTRIMRDWFHGEVLRDLSHEAREDARGLFSVQQWLREQFIAAIKRAFTGHDQESMVVETIKREVGRYMQGKGYSTNDDRFTAFVRKVVEEEVRKQIVANVTISATIKGTVHSPAAGARAINLRDALPDEPWED